MQGRAKPSRGPPVRRRGGRPTGKGKSVSLDEWRRSFVGSSNEWITSLPARWCLGECVGCGDRDVAVAPLEGSHDAAVFCDVCWDGLMAPEVASAKEGTEASLAAEAAVAINGAAAALVEAAAAAGEEEHEASEEAEALPEEREGWIGMIDLEEVERLEEQVAGETSEDETGDGWEELSVAGTEFTCCSAQTEGWEEVGYDEEAVATLLAEGTTGLYPSSGTTGLEVVKEGTACDSWAARVRAPGFAPPPRARRPKSLPLRQPLRQHVQEPNKAKAFKQQLPRWGEVAFVYG